MTALRLTRMPWRDHLVIWVDADDGTPVPWALVDIVVPQSRVSEMRRVTSALEAMPAQHQAPVGDHRRRRLPGLHRPRAARRRRRRRLLAAQADRGPALPGHRLQRRAPLRRASGAAGRTGDDHARRAVQDDRPRRDRVDRAGPRRDDPGRRRRRPRRRRGRRSGRASAPPPTSAACASSRFRRRSSPRSTPRCGGKTGVDLPEAKNYVGAYHQPQAVIADTDALATLPARGAGRRLRRGGQDGAHRRRGPVGAGPGRRRVGGARLARGRDRMRPHQAEDRRPRRARRRRPPGAQPRPHRRSRDRGRHRLCRLPPRRGGGARAAGGAAALGQRRPARRGGRAPARAGPAHRCCATSTPTRW